VAGETSQRRLGRRASANAAIHRQMREQSLRTPWRELAKACEELIEWHSFALWVRAIVDAERSFPQWLQEAIESRCPGFTKLRPTAVDGDSIWLDLSEWIENHFFAVAREGGWIDALHYYSGQDPRSEQILNHWTSTETAWRKDRPGGYPTFNQWHEEALNAPLDPGRAHLRTNEAPAGPLLDRFSGLVSQYIEWEAFAFWARSIVESTHEVPALVKSSLEQRCPGFVSQIQSKDLAPADYSTWFWRELLEWIENHMFADAKKASWLDAVRAAARAHLRGERVAAYWAVCNSRWGDTRPDAYPGFERWLQDADAFVAK